MFAILLGVGAVMAIASASSRSKECPFRESPGNTTTYQENQPGKGWVPRPCPQGTVYKHASCGCLFDPAYLDQLKAQIANRSRSGSTLTTNSSNSSNSTGSSNGLQVTTPSTGGIKQPGISTGNNTSNSSGVITNKSKGSKTRFIEAKTTSPLGTCQKHKDGGHHQSGLYELDFQDGSPTLKVYCDMVTAGKAWAVFHRRENGSEDFYRVWEDYENGFGDLEKEFWLGNKHIHRLTAMGMRELRVDLKDFHGRSVYATYSKFAVAEASEMFRLGVSGFSGDAGDGLSTHSGCSFSTRDEDNDQWESGSCATWNQGGWWYGKCATSNLNGPYGLKTWGSKVGNHWWPFGGATAVRVSEMKVR